MRECRVTSERQAAARAVIRDGPVETQSRKAFISDSSGTFHDCLLVNPK